MNPGMGITQQFLEECLLARWRRDALQNARQLSSQPGLDWDVALETISSENIGPLLYVTLQQQDILPERVEEALKASYQWTRVRNTILFDQAREILRIFEAEGIPTILLKGAALASQVYQDHALRPCGDVDFLLAGEQVNQALKLLQARGYQAERFEDWEEFTLRYENEVLLYRDQPVRTIVELHWNLIDSPYYQNKLDLAWFWQTARALDFYGQPAQTLGLEAQVIYLCAHLSLHHAGTGWLWLHDIAEMLYQSSEKINWQEVIQQAQQNDLVLPVKLTLLEVHKRFLAPIPERVLHQLEHLQPTEEERRVFANLGGKRAGAGRRFWDDLTSIPGWKARLDFAWQNLFPSPRYMLTRYQAPHPALLPLYYPYRWFLGLRSLVRRNS